MYRGYIKGWRKLLDWEWYTDANTFRLFMHLLFTVNYEDKKWRGITIKAGQIVTGRKTLSKQLCLSEQNIRTSLDKLKLTNEVTIKSTSRYSIITVNNWNEYQQTNQQTNQQLTTTKEIKKERNISLSSKKNITENEREILIKYVEKNKLAKSSVRAYVNALIKNGDYKDILETEQNKKQRKAAKQNQIKEDLLKVTNKYKACLFVGKYGDFTDVNHPEEVKNIMSKYDIESFTKATEYVHNQERED